MPHIIKLYQVLCTSWQPVMGPGIFCQNLKNEDFLCVINLEWLYSIHVAMDQDPALENQPTNIWGFPKLGVPQNFTIPFIDGDFFLIHIINHPAIGESSWKPPYLSPFLNPSPCLHRPNSSLTAPCWAQSQHLSGPLRGNRQGRRFWRCKNGGFDQLHTDFSPAQMGIWMDLPRK